MTYRYYPGCSIKAQGRAYEESLVAVFRALGLELAELDDWNCCGATAYMNVDETQAFALAARNLALAEADDCDLVAPCSACYLVLSKTQRRMREDALMGQRLQRALGDVGLSYRGDSVGVRHPLDILVNDVGLQALQARVTNPLTGLKVAPYYGCQIVRPHATFDDQRDPRTMDRLLAAAGCEVVDYPLKTRCCGGTQTSTIPEVGLRLAYVLLREARRRQADAIVTVCPLCQFNLEAYQDRIEAEHGACSVPVVYFTQLLGLALGLTENQVGLQRALVPLGPVLKEREVSHAGRPCRR